MCQGISYMSKMPRRVKNVQICQKMSKMSRSVKNVKMCPKMSEMSKNVSMSINIKKVKSHNFQTEPYILTELYI